MEIFTRFNRRPHKANNSGSKEEPHYIEKRDKNGKKYLEQDGKTQVYEKIQSYKEECDVHYILERWANGAAQPAQGMYIDTTQIPTNYADYFNLMKEQQQKFKELPTEIKQKFNNDFEEWAITSGTEEWANKMGFTKPTESKPANAGSDSSNSEKE